MSRFQSLFLLFALALPAAPATIQGTVQDPSGAVVPGAEVTVSTTATPEIKTVKSDSQGRFSIDVVPAGQIRVGCGPIGGSMEQSGGAARITLAAGQHGTVEIQTVRREHPELKTKLGFAIEGGTDDLRIRSVPPGSAAARAGLVPGDIVTAVDGVPVDRLIWWGLQTLLLDRPPGTHVRLGVDRGGQHVSADLVVEALF